MHMRGERVTLRPLLKEDSPHYFKWINHKELVLCNAAFKPVSEQEHEAWFSKVTSDPNAVLFSIVANQDNRLIGSCSLRRINMLHKNAELQIRIGEIDYHNRGFGSEAVHLLVQYGFANLNLERIYLHVFANNKKAIKAYEKCKFQQEGILRKAAYVNGSYINVHIMAILKDETY
ncbi:N-acetyltransferase [Legionella septentrionalis]|nr:N-acetyltransferase [Legionella septentrionalis]RUR11850.1 N-acetyltransferase [Legionella septentrionalis]RUR17537.1 N-acetyltransferase [Legionella septentrionalis]